MNLAQFKSTYPQLPLANLDDSVIQQVLDEAVLLITQGRWGNKTELAQALYAAHVLTLMQQANNAQGQAALSIARKKVGDVEIQYNMASANAAWYDLTFYGQRFWQLQLLLSPTTGAMVL